MRFSEHLKKASLVGAFFVSVLFQMQAVALCRADRSLTQVDVARVVDGDTVRLVDGRSVRLIGLDTPELGRKGRSDEPFAVVARQRLQALVDASGGRLGLMVGRQAKDHYGRTLAHLFGVGGENLEAALLAEGVGFFVAIAPNTRFADCHQAAEQQARLARKALWRRSPSISPEHIRTTGFALVTANVERFERNRGGLWLVLQGPLVVHIPRQAAADFKERDLEQLVGRSVEVRGWVVDRKTHGKTAQQARWMVRVSHPSMLRLMD